MTAYHLSGPVPIKRPVTLPADFPIVEKRAPIGLAVLTVLLVVGVGYAAWHYLPREQSVVAEKVPPVPDRLLASHPNPAPSTERSRAATTSAPAAGGRRRRSRPRKRARRPATCRAEVWPARREAAAPPPPQPPQGTPLAPPVVAAVPPPPPPPVVMNLPAPARRRPLSRRHLPSSRASPPQQPQPPQQAAAPAVEEAGTSARGETRRQPSGSRRHDRQGARQQLDRAACAQRRRSGADLCAGRRKLRRAGRYRLPHHRRPLASQYRVAGRLRGWISAGRRDYIGAMSIRPYRDIVRRKSRQIMVGSGAGRRRRADHRPDR